MKKVTRIIFILPILTILLNGCEKFLNEKSDKSLSVPVSVADFKAMLNNSNVLNGDFISAGEVSSDDYYLLEEDYNALYYENDKRLYTWEPDYVSRPAGLVGHEWQNCYRAILMSNFVLHGLEENKLTGKEADVLKGQALVFRAARYLDGVQVWAPAYDEKTANVDLGMVIRIDPDMNLPSKRSSVSETYQHIISDLTLAIDLLPKNDIDFVFPSRSTAHALLARTYLFMGNYENALNHAQLSIEESSAIILDFNDLDVSADFPIPSPNTISPEMMIWTTIFGAPPLAQHVAKINPELYSLYQEGDLRKMIYFKENDDGSHSFKGTHFGYFTLMNSVTPSEMHLIIAECNVRIGSLSKGEEFLNQLLINRYDKDQFEPISFVDKESALRVVLEERRKELVMRGLRWADIKRLNRDGFNIALTRTLGEESFSLLPNDLRFAIAIPEDVIELSGIEQNPR